MDKIKTILCFNNVEENLCKNPQLNYKNKIIDMENINISNIKQFLTENSFNSLNNLNQTAIESQLNDNKLYQIPIKDYNLKYDEKLAYINNCQIIKKNKIEIIKEIDKKNSQEIQILKCLYSDKKKNSEI